MEDFIPNRIEIKILKALKMYQNNGVTIQSLHGYFKFNDFTELLVAIQSLVKHEYIYVQKHPFEFLYLSDPGTRFLLQESKKTTRNFWVATATIAGLVIGIMQVIQPFK